MKEEKTFENTIDKNENDNIDLINKYFDLYEKGAITQEEFQKKKKTILR